MGCTPVSSWMKNNELRLQLPELRISGSVRSAAALLRSGQLSGGPNGKGNVNTVPKLGSAKCVYRMRVSSGGRGVVPGSTDTLAEARPGGWPLPLSLTAR